jgi:hypothetical protein
MTLDGLITQINAARYVRNDDNEALKILKAFSASRQSQPKQRPTMPTFNFGSRTSLTELRPRHLLMVEEHGHQEHYDRDALRDYFLTNYHRMFGPLRKSKALEVPSDRLRKEMIVEQFLELIEMRRSEYAEERAEIEGAAAYRDSR